MKETISLFNEELGDDVFHAPYEHRQEVRETFSSFSEFVERCALIYGRDEGLEPFESIVERLQRPSRFGGNDINELS